MPQDKAIKIGFLRFSGFPMSCLTSMIVPQRAGRDRANYVRVAGNRPIPFN
ncbi:MAG: hypothetical protein ACJASV_003136 [Pseudorhodobacter sp.]|jgi:hypothetical protein